MKKISLPLLSTLLLLTISCSHEKIKSADNKFLTVATFNVEWLGDGVNDRKDRTDADYRLIAEIISQTEADIIALQEIENEEALNLLIEYLPDYNYFIGNEGRQQNVAVLYNKSVTAKFIEEYMPVAIEQGRNRPGLVAEFRRGNFDFLMMVVHFKSTSRFDDTKEKLEHSRDIRLKQSQIVSLWADSVLKHGKEKDLIVLGDFNDTPTRKRYNTMYPLTNNNNLKFLTDSLKSCKYRTMYSIDHFVVTKSAHSRLLEGSVRMYDFRAAIDKNAAKNVSDHCPVIAEFEIESADNDK